VRRLVLIAPAVFAAVALAGCGSQGVVTPTPVTVVGSVPKAAQKPVTPAFKLKGDATAGKSIFASAGCSSCHTLAAAHATGTVGPNLDQLKPDYRAVTAQVTLGGAQMPSFKSSLSAQTIADVAAFVVNSTGGKAP
jgi:mono/diheme cytochrome c family protein